MGIPKTFSQIPSPAHNKETYSYPLWGSYNISRTPDFQPNWFLGEAYIPSHCQANSPNHHHLLGTRGSIPRNSLPFFKKEYLNYEDKTQKLCPNPLGELLRARWTAASQKSGDAMEMDCQARFPLFVDLVTTWAPRHRQVRAMFCFFFLLPDTGQGSFQAGFPSWVLHSWFHGCYVTVEKPFSFMILAHFWASPTLVLGKPVSLWSKLMFRKCLCFIVPARQRPRELVLCRSGLLLPPFSVMPQPVQGPHTFW